MDLRMPRVDGVAATRRLRERDPGIKALATATPVATGTLPDGLPPASRRCCR
jgi:CheY-like chemotaxis protein